MGCPTHSEYLSADALADASDVVDTATMSYAPPKDDCMIDGASAVDAHPVEDNPTKPTLILAEAFEVEDMLGVGPTLLI